VIDCGRNTEWNYDPESIRLVQQLKWVTQSTPQLRQGRIIRLQPGGKCFRLYSHIRELTFPAHPTPEVKRTSLEELILQIKLLHLGDVATYLRELPEPPDERTVNQSLELLGKLGALDSANHLTPLGLQMAKLSNDPKIVKLMMMGVIFGCLEPMLSIAAALTFRDPFVKSPTPAPESWRKEHYSFEKYRADDEMRKFKKERFGHFHRSDLALIAILMNNYRNYFVTGGKEAADTYAENHHLDPSTMWTLMHIVDQFCRDLYDSHLVSSPLIRDQSNKTVNHYFKVHLSLIFAGLFPNIAQVVPKQCFHPPADGCGNQCPFPTVMTAEDGQVTIHRDSISYGTRDLRSSWFCYFRKVENNSIFLHDCSLDSSFSLLFFF